MRILVTVKFTPDLQSNRTFTDGRVTRTADDGSMNELDEHAVEAAGEGEVYALTVGGLDAVAAGSTAVAAWASRKRSARSTAPTSGATSAADSSGDCEAARITRAVPAMSGASSAIVTAIASPVLRVRVMWCGPPTALCPQCDSIPGVTRWRWRGTATTARPPLPTSS